VLGVGDSSLQSKMAEALANLGCTRGWVVHGEDGLDEISLAGPTRIEEIRDGRRETFIVSPDTFGIHAADCAHLRADSAAASAAQTLAVLNNTADRCATGLVILNAAAALVVGLDLDPRSAADLSRSVIVNGTALAKLETMRSLRKEQSA
jgi:anthranilate phosphoribosyltransferase